MSESAPQSALAAVIEAAYLAGSVDAHLTEHGPVRVRLDPLRLGTLEAAVDGDAALDELLGLLSEDQRTSLERGHPQDIQGTVEQSEGEEPWRYRATIFLRGFGEREHTAVLRSLPRETSFGPPFEPVEVSSPLGTNPGLISDRFIAGMLRSIQPEEEVARREAAKREAAQFPPTEAQRKKLVEVLLEMPSFEAYFENLPGLTSDPAEDPEAQAAESPQSDQ